MLFADGYRAMDALDDNRDGDLSGDELDGLAAWFDRNSDGRCDPGEVTPLTSLGIASLATTPLSEEEGSLANPVGLGMADRRSLPTYDWVTRPAPQLNGPR